MTKRESLARYNLIIKKLRKHPANFAEISDYLALESELQGYNFNISKRTFTRDLEDIRSLYNIDIQYNYTKRAYRIEYEVQQDMNERVLEAFDIFNALNVSERLSKHIHFEKRKPQGTENLYGLLHAIKNQLQIKFTYQKYWDDKVVERTVEPYALKEFRSRWYVLANDLKDSKVKSFSLDRLTELEITKRAFQTPINFNVVEHYKYSFGIISPNEEKPQEITLSFNPIQGKYIKSLPLHNSQQILEDNNKELRIKLTLFITHDFFMELLSHGDNVKILKPDTLIEDLKLVCKNVLEKYGER